MGIAATWHQGGTSRASHAQVLRVVLAAVDGASTEAAPREAC